MAGIRSAPSVLIHPLEAEFGWTRTEIASAASLNLLLLGLFAPVGGLLIDRYGPRRVPSVIVRKLSGSSIFHPRSASSVAQRLALRLSRRAYLVL